MRLIVAALLALLSFGAVAQQQIPSLTPAGTLTGTEMIPLDQSGTKRATPNQVLNHVMANGATASTSAKGLAPQCPGGTTLFFRGDCTFAAPPTGGGGTAQTLFAPFFGYVAGAYYLQDTTATGAAPGANSIRLHPVPIQQQVTISGLALRITTQAASGFVQGACYAADATTKRPTGLPIAQSASVGTPNAIPVDVPFTTPLPSAPTMLWCGFAFDNATAVAASIPNLIGNNMSRMFGYRALADTSSGSSQSSPGLVFTMSTFGTWPDLTSVSGTLATGANVPAAWIKIGSVP